MAKVFRGFGQVSSLAKHVYAKYILFLFLVPCSTNMLGVQHCPRLKHRHLHRLCLNIFEENGGKFYVLNAGGNPMVFNTTIARLVIANYGAI
jgi:hypothetical protein